MTTSAGKDSCTTTRGQLTCPIFGSPQELRDNVLPTCEQVLRYFSWIKLQKENAGDYKPKVAEICEMISKRLEEIWGKSSIPVIHHVRINALINREHEKLRNLKKSFKNRKHTESYEKKLNCFKEESKKLFDIAACKCTDFSLCVCEKSRKVPQRERDFLMDQRAERRMIIGNTDKRTTKDLMKRQVRTAKTKTAQLQAIPSTSKGFVVFERTESRNVTRNMASLSTVTDVIPQTRLNLETFARTCDRYGLTDRPAAALASALMFDLHKSDSETPPSVVDRSKVRRERKKVRKNLQNQTSSEGGSLQAIYFDGRHDKTLFMESTEHGSFHRRVKKEEHISLLQEPGSIYLGHISPTSSSANSIKTAIWDYLTVNNIDTSKLRAIGCDGTAVNTGNIGGVITLLEKELDRPLQWVICQLHCNELPLRHILECLDGPTAGPHGFQGPIGKRLNCCENLPVVNFQSIPSTSGFPAIDTKNLSTDQKYMWDICQAVSSGQCEPNIASRSPGKLSHARWITTANRILRLYISTNDPSENLTELATFIMLVYAPSWFYIKRKPSLVNASRNLWRTIYFTKYMKDEVKTVVHSTLQRNGFYAHPENLLLAMLADERKEIRTLAVNRIFSSRASSKSKYRKFVIPKINFSSEDYVGLINWEDLQITEPPLTFNLSKTDLEHLINEGLEVNSLPRKLPCHTQAVERCVKVVTEASMQVCGQSARDGVIRARFLDRNLMATFNTKSEYRPA